MSRARRTKARTEQLRKQISEVLEQDNPQSVRHVFYRMTDPRLPEPVEKSDRGYVTVQRLLVQMRREGAVPFGWVTDSSRSATYWQTFADVAEAIDHAARSYAKSVWDTLPDYVELWCESRSIASVLEAEATRHRVPLLPTGGFASLSMLYDAAGVMANRADDRPITILYVGDHDPAGVLIDRQIEAELRGHLDSDVDLTMRRLAVTVDQIALMGLPTKPTSDTRGEWNGGTVEAEAIPAGQMRQIVRGAIEAFIPDHALKAMNAAQESERDGLRRIASMIRGGDVVGLGGAL